MASYSPSDDEEILMNAGKDIGDQIFDNIFFV